jgi:hypothetical protein
MPVSMVCLQRGFSMGKPKFLIRMLTWTFNGKIDLTKEKTYYKFKANLEQYADLFALNFVTDTLTVSSYFDINLESERHR